MALRDLLRRAPANTPAPIEAATQAEGMDGTIPFGPGRPINPFFGYSTRPRAFDYPVGANITTRPREAYGRMSFGFMKTLIDAYWLARACVNHKIDNVRSMELLFSPAAGVDYDVSDAITAARAALACPDRELPFDAWLSKWLENLFRYDAACLYRHRDRAGRVIGLDVVDGTTITPYIDGQGRRPKPPAPAYGQLIKGVPGEWLTSDDLIYTPFRPQPDSPYGMAPIESIQIAANTDLRFQMWCLQYFTAGSLPAGFLRAPENVSTPDQVQAWQDFWDALMIGDQEALRQIKVIPHDMLFEPVRESTFDERFPLHLARITCAAYGVVPQDLGITLDVNRAVGETQIDVQFRINDRPVMMFVQNILTSYIQRDLGLPVAVSFDDGQAKEDRLHEAQAWQIYTNSGYASVDEARAKLLGLPVDPSRPVPRIILDPRIGPVPLSSIEAVSGRINPHSLSPSADAPLPQVTPDTAAPAIVPNKASGEPAAPANPEPPQFIPAPKHPADGTPSVANPQAVKETAGVTSATGITGVDLVGNETEERARFGRYVKSRAKKNRWRDFDFIHVPADEAAKLNADARKAWAAKSSATLPLLAVQVVKASPKDRPSSRYEKQLVAYWTQQIQRAIRLVTAPSALAAKLFTIFAMSGRPDPAPIAASVQLDQAELTETLHGLYADAYTAGIKDSEVPGLPQDYRETIADFEDWKPGAHVDASRLARTGFSTLLAKSDVTIKGIDDTTRDLIGEAVADAIAAGDGVKAAAERIETILRDPQRAELIAITEINRAMTQASLDAYRASGIEQWDLITAADPCPICAAVAAANPHPMSDTADKSPLHPRCRCAVSPALEV